MTETTRAPLTDDLIDQLLDELYQARMDANSTARTMGLTPGQLYELKRDVSRATVRSFLKQAGVL